MSTKISKDELRSPDQVTQSLRKGFIWTTTHSKIVITAFTIFVIIGLSISLMSYFNERKEVAQQEKFFTLEKRYMMAKEGFIVTPATANNPASGKKASGDLTADFGPIVGEFEAFLADDSKSVAAQMAALNLSDLYLSYKKNDEALATVQKIEKSLSKKEMVSAMLLLQWGNILANKEDCQGAIEKWTMVANNKHYNFAQSEAKLRMGVCYESLNDSAKAEQLYTEVSKAQGTSGDMASSREAQKYLRLLNAKKNL